MGQMTTFNINPLHRIIAQADPLGKIPDRENPRNPRMTYTHNAGSQLTKAEPEGGSATDYTYDANGNRVTEAGPTSTTTLTWDYENRRVLGSNSLGIEYEDAYDADGRRFREKLTIGGIEQYVRKYVWDFENVLLETNGSNVTQTIYTLEPATFDNLVSKRASGATQYYHFDALGSTANLTDSSQTVVNDYLYTAFGVPVAGSANLAQPYTYVGQLGYYSVGSPYFTYVRARWYQPSTIVWLSEDPISQNAQELYIYVGNQPTAVTDPSGLLVPALAAALVVACTGCAVCVGPPFYACITSSNDIDEFIDCLNTYIDSLPWYHHACCGALCGACIAAAVAGSL